VDGVTYALCPAFWRKTMSMIEQEEDDDLAFFERIANDDTPEVIEKREGVEEYRLKISAAWQKAVQPILETARLCRETKFMLTPFELRELKAKLPFSPATFSKLDGIAGDERINRMADQLPPNWTIIYDLHLLSNGMLKKAEEANIITPKLQRQVLQSWLKANDALPARSKKIPLPSLPIGFEAGIRVPHGYPEDRREELHTALGALCAQFEVQLVRQLDEELARVLGYIKVQATKVIKQERLSRRAVARRQDKAASWPYDWNETNVADARSPDDVRFMFQQIGMELDFDVIEQKARDRLARRLHWAGLRAASEAEPKPTAEEEMAELKEALANVPSRKFLRRRRSIVDFEPKDDGAAGEGVSGSGASDDAIDITAGGDSGSEPVAAPDVEDCLEGDVSPGKRA
jgi:hypothetical protein